MKALNIIVAGICCLHISLVHSHAQSLTWQGADDAFWSAPSSWQPGRIPTSSDTVLFPSNSVTGLNTVMDLSTPIPFAISNLRVEGGYDFQMGGNTLRVSDDLEVLNLGVYDGNLQVGRAGARGGTVTIGEKSLSLADRTVASELEVIRGRFEAHVQSLVIGRQCVNSSQATSGTLGLVLTDGVILDAEDILVGMAETEQLSSVSGSALFSGEGVSQITSGRLWIADAPLAQAGVLRGMVELGKTTIMMVDDLRVGGVNGYGKMFFARSSSLENSLMLRGKNGC